MDTNADHGGLSDPGSRGGKTQVQTPESLSRSADLSIPAHVQPHPSAPKLTGYILTQSVGEGAYGQVWRAWQLRTRKEVAVKVFTHRTGLDWILLQREVERLTRLDRHPHIVTLLDTGLDEEPPFYAMDFIESGSLQRWVNPQAPAEPALVLRWVEQICDALAYVHAKGLIHCDLKPANILVDTQDRIRVVDFGQSRIFTESGASMGTLFYMSPEQAVLAGPDAPVQPDIRWDVYALGATVYAILTGEVPFADGASVQELETAPTLLERLRRYREMIDRRSPLCWPETTRNRINPELTAIVGKCMARGPETRYATVTAVVDDIRAFRAHRPVSPLADRAGYRARKFVRRNPLAIVLGVVTLGLLAAGVAFGFQRRELDRGKANAYLANFVRSPIDASTALSGDHARVRRYVHEATERCLASTVEPERVLGVWSAPWVAEEALWREIDRGLLGTTGEWLELCALPSSARGALAPALMDRLTSGSPREKYAAACLAGQLFAAELPPNELAPILEEMATRTNDNAVTLAARWAAQRWNLQVSPSSRAGIFTDDLSGLIFVTVESKGEFFRGSDQSDVDRYPDEERPAVGVKIGPIYVASTEITLNTVSDFLKDAEPRNLIEPDAARQIRALVSAVPSGALPEVAAGYLSLNSARALCTWLNGRAANLSPRRHYRLPTEEEWEFACRGGNPGRFCFGDSTKYVRYFAHCNGSKALYHTVGRHMPNAYGLFDMHGGVWEWTDTPYPPELIDDAPGSTGLTFFVCRGGAWYSPAVRCRSAQRHFMAMNRVDHYVGVRLVMEMRP